MIYDVRQSSAYVYASPVAHARHVLRQIPINRSSDAKLARAKALGAACGINYKTTPDWDKAAIAFNHGHGVDQVL